MTQASKRFFHEKKNQKALVLIICVGVLHTAADAHALLQAAVPAVGGHVATAPAQITMDFSEALEPRFSTVVVTASDGTTVDKGDLHTAPDNAERVLLSLSKLSPGTYTVTWHAVSVDTHKTQGSYRFTVGGP